MPRNWVNSDERKELLRSTSNKHSALFNTCVHVYTNYGRGSTFEILPANFFVDPYTVFPGESGKTVSNIQTDHYLFWGAFGYNYSSSTSFSYYAKNEEDIAGKCMTTWLWPTIADIYSIFTGGDNPSGLQAFSSNQTFSSGEDRVDVFKHSAVMAFFKGDDTPKYDCCWWLPNESGQESTGNNVIRLTQASVIGSTITINTNVLHKSDEWKAYVLPIRYF